MGRYKRRKHNLIGPAIVLSLFLCLVIVLVGGNLYDNQRQAAILATSATSASASTSVTAPTPKPDVIKQITVAKSGGDYTIITDAVAHSNDSVANPVTILVMPGTYVESVDLRGRYISIIGNNKETCILKNYLNDYNSPPLNMGANNYIENMTIISDQDGSTPIRLGSYGIHHDYPSQVSGLATSKIQNCIVISKQNAAIGLGLNDRQTATIDNCELHSYTVYSLYAHNQQGNGGTQQKLIVKNCRIEVEIAYAAIMIQDANHREGGGYEDARDTVMSFYNNTIQSKIAGKNGMLGGDKPLEKEYFAGYIKLGADSSGNNIPELNVIH